MHKQINNADFVKCTSTLIHTDFVKDITRLATMILGKVHADEQH